MAWLGSGVDSQVSKIKYVMVILDRSGRASYCRYLSTDPRDHQSVLAKAHSQHIVSSTVN